MKFILFIFFSLQLFAQSFEQQALEYVQKKYSEFDKIEIEQRNKSEKTEKIIIDKSREPNLGRGFILIPVFIENNSVKKQSFFTFKIKLFKKVLIADEDIRSQSSFSKNNFMEELVEVTSLNGTPFTDLKEIAKYRSKSFLRNGDILLKEKIELIPMINTGDKILAEVKYGNVFITTDALARQSGNEGDVIRIISNNKMLNAKVIDHNKVIVE
jgi:flagella basal body P-ring formation protein FlgA